MPRPERFFPRTSLFSFHNPSVGNYYEKKRRPRAWVSFIYFSQQSFHSLGINLETIIAGWKKWNPRQRHGHTVAKPGKQKKTSNRKGIWKAKGTEIFTFDYLWRFFQIRFDSVFFCVFRLAFSFWRGKFYPVPKEVYYIEKEQDLPLLKETHAREGWRKTLDVTWEQLFSFIM